MSNKQQARVETFLPNTLEHESTLFPRRDPIYRVPSGTSCELDAEGHCVTCSDEALPARVLWVDQESGLAQVSVKNTIEEIDITLVDTVTPGDILLVHGGVAIAHQGEASHE